MKQIWFLIIFTLFFTGCHQSLPASPYLLKNVYGESVIVYDLPLVLNFEEGFPKDKVDEFDKAVADLNKNLGMTAIVLSHKFIRADFFNKSKDGQNIIFWGRDNIENIFSPSEQAKTSLFWVGSNIKEVDIRFNAVSYDNFKDIDLNSLIRHEMAHAVGFIHSHDDQELMGAYLPSGVKKGDLPLNAVFDFQKLHNQSKTSVGFLNPL